MKLTNWFNDLFRRAKVPYSEPSKESRSIQGYSSAEDAATFLLRKHGLEGLTAIVTAHNAMGIATFFGCVKLISNVMSSLPYSVFRYLENGGSQRDLNHDLDYVIHTRFNENMSSVIARRTLITNWLVYGWAIAEIKRDVFNNVISIIPYPTSEVFILYDDETDKYFFKIPTKNKTLSQHEVIFLRDISFDGNMGVSIIKWQSQVIKIDLLAKQFTQKYYENGTFMGGLLETPNGGNSEEIAKEYKRRIIESAEGDSRGGGGFAVLGPNVKWHQISRPPVESQLMELFSKTSADIAQMFNIPLSMIGNTEGDTSWGTGVEQMFIRVTNTVFIPIAVQVEQEINYKCFRKDEIKSGWYTKHNFKGLLRGDLKAQAEYNAKMVNSGIDTPDEVRALDEKPKLPDGVGAFPYMQGAMIPMKLMSEVKLAKQNKNGNGKKSPPAGTE